MKEIIFLSITQGITEFLPISSSAHLIIISKYFGFNNENLTLDISLHLGSLLAVIYFFKEKIFNFIQNKFLFTKIVVASIPTLLVGFLIVKLGIIQYLRNTYLIGITTIFFGILIYFSDKCKTTKNIEDNFNLRNAILIGVLQALSLIPGVSRSGITITCARFLNFNRVDSAKISFLLSIPTLTAVSFYTIIKLIELKNFQITLQNFWGLILSFVFSFIALKYFIKFLKSFSLNIFVIYRIILGVILLNVFN